MLPSSKSSPRRTAALVNICLSALGFSLMATCVRLADVVGEALPAIEKAFFRNLVAIAIALPLFLKALRQGEVRLRMVGLAAWRDIALRSILGTLGIFTNFYALSKIPIGDAMALNKTAPFFTLVLSYVMLNERMTKKQLLCTLGAFGGALLVIKPGFSGGLSVDAFIGLFSGFCAGAAYAILHRLGKNKVNGAFIIFVFSCFSCLVSVPFMVFDFHPMNVKQLLVLFGAGAGAAIGQFGITLAYRFAEPRQIAVYDYSGIIFTSLFGLFVFAQVPDIYSIVGFTIIITMALAIFRAKQ